MINRKKRKKKSLLMMSMWNFKLKLLKGKKQDLLIGICAAVLLFLIFPVGFFFLLRGSKAEANLQEISPFLGAVALVSALALARISDSSLSRFFFLQAFSLATLTEIMLAMTKKGVMDENTHLCFILSAILVVSGLIFLKSPYEKAFHGFAFTSVLVERVYFLPHEHTLNPLVFILFFYLLEILRWVVTNFLEKKQSPPVFPLEFAIPGAAVLLFLYVYGDIPDDSFHAPKMLMQLAGASWAHVIMAGIFSDFLFFYVIYFFSNVLFGFWANKDKGVFFDDGLIPFILLQTVLFLTVFLVCYHKQMDFWECLRRFRDSFSFIFIILQFMGEHFYPYEWLAPWVLFLGFVILGLSLIRLLMEEIPGKQDKVE